MVCVWSGGGGGARGECGGRGTGLECSGALNRRPNNITGWSGQAMVLGNFQYRDVLIIGIIVGQGPTVLAVGAGGVFEHLFSRLTFLFSLSFSQGDDPI